MMRRSEPAPAGRAEAGRPAATGRGEALAWTIAAALAAGCCAPQPIGSGEAPAVDGPEVPADTGFVTIDVEEARRRLWPEPGPAAYAIPDAVQAAALGDLIRRMLGDPAPASPAELADAAARAGFEVQGWEVDGHRYLAAIEQTTRRGGGGAYVVRQGGGSAVILQAPHGFFDVGTERIGLELLLSGRVWPRALFVNTVHRYLGPDGVKRKRGENPADPCHSPQHLLAVATAAALDVLPQAEVIQLHGFGEGDDEDAGPMPAAIVSGGLADHATPRSRIIAANMRARLGVEVALFPVDIDRLGATTNVQGRAIRARGDADFVHIEMSRALREQLRRDPAARAQLAEALRQDAGPVTSGPVTSGPVTSGPVTSGSVPSGPVTSGSVPSGSVPSGPVPSGSVTSGSVTSGPVTP